MTSLSGRGRLNPESYEGSLIWWLRVPTPQQNYLQAILEAYDDLGYYQTFGACSEKTNKANPYRLLG